MWLTTSAYSSRVGSSPQPTIPTSPLEVDSLNDDELLEALAELDRLELFESPAQFAQIISRQDAEPWLPYEHLMLLNDRLMELIEGGTTRLLVTMPPRHGKSLLSSLYTPAWYLNKYPERRVILCSYGDDFAAEWGRKVRDLIDNHQDKLSISINRKSQAADRWDLDGHNGGMKTAGVGGQITGRGAHLMIIDDPIKDAAEADSATIREQKWHWWRTTARTRLEPDAVVILIQTRWHEDDLAGRILKDNPEQWTVINLPALAEEEDALGRTPGVALCPQRYDVNALAMIRHEVGSRTWNALYQQRPSPEGGGFFKRSDFRYWTRHESEEGGFIYALDDPVEGTLLIPQGECWRFITMDLAITTRTSSDYTVAAIWDVAAYLEPSRLILRHIDRLRIEGSEHEGMVRKLWRDWKPSFIGIEEALHGSLVLSQARRDGIIVRPLHHRSKDKMFRAKEAALLMEVHRVFTPKRTDWIPEWEHELLLFPSGTHDDQVDAFSYAAHELLRGVNLKPKKKQPYEAPSIEDRAWKQLREKHSGPRYHPVLGRL